MLAGTELTNATAVRGNVAVTCRDPIFKVEGRVSYTKKALHAQFAGAIALIIVNTSDSDLVPGGMSHSIAHLIKIPVVGVTKSAGIWLIDDMYVEIGE